MSSAIQQQTTPWEKYSAAVNDNAEYDSSVKEALLWAINKARSEGWFLGRLAEEVDSSSTVMQRLFMGNYGASIDKQIIKVKSYQALCEARDRQGDLPEFVMTPLARRVHSFADWAYHRSRVVNIIGKTQRGKTFAAEEYARRKGKNVIFVRCPFLPAPSRLLRRIAWAMGSSGMLSIDHSMDYIMSRMSSRHLLVIDEIHHVTKLDTRMGLQSVEMLREIKDLSGCGMVLLATEVWEEFMYHNDKWVGVLGQLVARGRTVRLKDNIPVDDLRKMWEHFGLPEPDHDHQTFVRAFANDEGLTCYTDALRDARNYSINKNVPLDWDAFDAARAISEKAEQGGK